MKKIVKWLRSPAATLTGFALAAGLLLFSTVGGVRAALLNPSEYYGAQVSMRDIGVSLIEDNGKEGGHQIVSYRNFQESSTQYGNGDFQEGTGALLTNMLAEGEQLQPGRRYTEKLSIQNTGEIDQYARVTVYKYWYNPEEKDGKDTQVSPSLIHLELDNIGTDWEIDEEATTPERFVLYYKHKLAVGEESSPFTKSIMIDGTLANKVWETRETLGDGSVKITTHYEFDGKQFALEATVDAVQDHHAADAIKSAWGVDGAAKGINIEE